MNRSSLDKLISTTGVVVAVVLLSASGALFYAHNFIHKQVHDQLAAQKIYFYPANNDAITSLPPADRAAMSKYADQWMTNGAQAETYADHFIAVHLNKIAGGLTYSEVSAKAMAFPTDQKLATEKQLLFQGESLRGLLLNAYAFDTMAVVAGYAAWGALVAGIVLLVLAVLGFTHAGVAAKRG